MPPEPWGLSASDEPTFSEPWQAKAFALVVLLHREGHFAWDDWVQTLAAEIKGSPQRADEDAAQAYHRQFLAALEHVVVAHGIIPQEAMAARKQAWRRAYLNTPHGHAVDLTAAELRDDHDHDDGDCENELVAQRSPLAVSPAQPRSTK